MTTKHGDICGCFTIVVIVALGFAVFAAFEFPSEQKERDSYWKTTCTVINCNDAYPHYSVVTFQSREPYSHNVTRTIKDGCQVHPIGSSRMCYVNAFNIKMEPVGVGGIVWLVFAGLFAIVVVAFIIGWIISCAHDYRTLSQSNTNFQHSTDPANTATITQTEQQGTAPLIVATQAPPPAPPIPNNSQSRNGVTGFVQVYDVDDEEYNATLHSLPLGTLVQRGDYS